MRSRCGARTRNESLFCRMCINDILHNLYFYVKAEACICAAKLFCKKGQQRFKLNVKLPGRVHDNHARTVKTVLVFRLCNALLYVLLRGSRILRRPCEKRSSGPNLK